MKKRVLWILFFLSCSFQSSWSFTCYLTVAKDRCWANYNVSIDLMDFDLNKKIMQLNIPKGAFWTRQKFDCHESQDLAYTAEFTPFFWEKDKEKTYHGIKNINLPKEINPQATAWTLSLCYPADFSQVPLPPEADNHCGCDFSSIPEISTQ